MNVADRFVLRARETEEESEREREREWSLFWDVRSASDDLYVPAL